MNPTRRAVVLGGLAVAATAGASASPDAALFEILDRTGSLLADRFDPARARASAAALLALAPEARVAALGRYLAGQPRPPAGLFAVLRMLVEIPSENAPPRPFPAVLQPGYLRPPALGAPVPPQPADLTSTPRWPVVRVVDVPLVVVTGYVLGGQAEPLQMHLDGLTGATWRTSPLREASAAEVRSQLIADRRWAGNPDVLERFEGQLARLEAG